MRHHSRLLAMLLVACTPLIAACDAAGSAERKMRDRVVGDWAFEVNAGGIEVSEVLTLRADSRWTRVITTEGAPIDLGESADSGNFRIQGVTLNLHSEVESGVPYRYTISGDTLYQANAAQTYAITGLDMGERVLVRVR